MSAIARVCAIFATLIMSAWWVTPTARVSAQTDVCAAVSGGAFGGGVYVPDPDAPQTAYIYCAGGLPQPPVFCQPNTHLNWGTEPPRCVPNPGTY